MLTNMNYFFISILVVDICLFILSFWKLFKKEARTNIPVWKTIQGSCGGILAITVLAITSKIFTEKVALFLIVVIVVYTIYYMLKNKRS